MSIDQPELVVQPLLDLPGHRTITSHRCLVAEPPQVGQRRVTVRHVRVGKRVAEVRAQIELALLRNAHGVGDRLRKLLEQRHHLSVRLKVQVMVGPQMRERLVDGRVELGRDQRVLEPRTLWAVVVDVVGGHDRRSGLASQLHEFPVAFRIPIQKIAVEFDVHRVRAVPLHVASQERACLVDATAHDQVG